jgi:hypothetical protein
MIDKTVSKVWPENGIPTPYTTGEEPIHIRVPSAIMDQQHSVSKEAPGCSNAVSEKTFVEKERESEAVLLKALSI